MAAKDSSEYDNFANENSGNFYEEMQSEIDRLIKADTKTAPEKIMKLVWATRYEW
jgi:hypothetical protein